jgi:hypothetical protein
MIYTDDWRAGTFEISILKSKINNAFWCLLRVKFVFMAVDTFIGSFDQIS